ERFENVGAGGRFERDEHADLAHAGRGGVVDIAGDGARVHRNDRAAAQRLIFTDRRDILRQLFGDGAAGRIGRGIQRVDVGDAAGERDLRHVADEALELLVLRNEIGFAVHFDHRAAVAVGGNADKAFGGDAAGLLGGGG